MGPEKGPERRPRLKWRPARTSIDSTPGASRRRLIPAPNSPQGNGGEPEPPPTKPGWTFLTNHAHVLLCIADETDIRGRDIAARVGITERAAQAIIADLVAGGYIRRRREGRRNRYSVDPQGPMRHPLDHGHTVGDLFSALGHLSQTGRSDSPLDRGGSELAGFNPDPECPA